MADLFSSRAKRKNGVMNFVDEASACNSMKDELRKLMEQLHGGHGLQHEKESVKTSV